jgi:hypothetical protein
MTKSRKPKRSATFIQDVAKLVFNAQISRSSGIDAMKKWEAENGDLSQDERVRAFRLANQMWDNA